MLRKAAAIAGIIALLTLFLFSTTSDATAQASTLVINEILVGNASTNMDMDYYNYSAWIEIYNGGNTAVDLKNYTLSYLDNGADTPINWKVPISVSVPAKGRVIFWLDEQNKNRHASFELDMRGEWIKLLSPTNVVLDTVEYDMRGEGGVLLSDISYGRQGDGGSTWGYFDKPTPAAKNEGFSMASPVLASNLVFTPPGGYYSGNRAVTLTTNVSGGVIRYTTDGSIPTPTSAVYSGPINLTQPTVVRARVYAPGKLAGQPTSHSYLINVNRNLPVVSLATKPAHLFDNTIGIYVAGTNGITGKCSTVPVNWNRKWERPASMEMFETDGTRIVGQDVGIEIHGNCSRNFDRKSFEIKARRIYGDNDIDYQLFDDKPIDSYKRLILRNSGNDAQRMMMNDAVQHHIIMGMMDIDYMTARPVIVMLNGQYWGIYNLREKADEAYVEQNYDLDADTDFDMLENVSSVHAGTATAYNQLHNFVSNNDLRIAANYEYVKSQVDLEEYANYFMVEIYHRNPDWINNNMRYWKAHGEDGRWRWVLFDLDLAANVSNVGHNYFDAIIKDTRRNSLIFRKLMQNTEFRNDFVQRFASHINITYAPARVTSIISAYKATLAPEIPTHIARWRRPPTYSDWERHVASTFDFFSQRPVHMRNHLNSYLGSPGMANLRVNINGNGDVLAAGVQVPGSGFTGSYFKTIPMTLEAVPKPGTQFVRWQETGSTNPKITVTLTGNMTRTAVFGSAPPPPPVASIVINEIHYNPADAQGSDALYEFIELYNAGATTVNLTNYSLWEFAFKFPAGTFIDPGEYIVLAQTGATYEGKGYQVFQWTSGGLNNTSEQIILYDTIDRVVDTVTYKNSTPWPGSPNGGGPSLSLLDPALDNSLGENWAPSSAANGSPGAANTFGPPPPPPPSIVINEIHYNPLGDSDFDDAHEFLELVNTGAEEISLEGFSLSGVTYTFPAGATIAAGEYIVVAKLETTYRDNDYQVFQWTSGSLSNDGEAVTLRDAGGNEVDSVTYGLATPWPSNPNGFGPSLSLRSPSDDNSSGANWGASQDTGGSPGAANTIAAAPPPPPAIVINEIHYNPADSQGDDAVFEFVELYNAGATTINLEGFSTYGFDFVFPAGASIDPDEYIILAQTGATYEGNSYDVFQWTGGGLNNTSELLILYDVAGNEVDFVTYANATPWPTTPNGGGPSLSLISPTLDNRLAASWAASAGAGGTPGAANVAPPPTTASLTVVKQVVGAAPTGVWQFGGTLGSFTLPAAGGQQAFTGLTPGSFTVSETAVGGYTAAVSCTNGASGTSSVTVTLNAGDTVTCTFVNTKQAEPPPTGGCDPVPGNLLKNPGFESDKANWTLHTNGAAGFTTTTADPAQCNRNARVNITTRGSTIQFYQTGFTLKPNTSYTLRLTARSSGGEDVSLYVHQHLAPNTNYGLANRAINLTTEWKTFDVSFTTKGFSSQTTDTRLRIWMGPYAKNGTVYEFDDVILVEGSLTTPPPPPTTATLTVVKQVVGAAPTGVWQFGGTLGSFTLPAAGGQRVFSNLTPGSFTISETAVGGYSAAVSCTNGASGTNSVSVTLNAGNAVTCTFVNTNESGPPPPTTATLTVVKQVVGAAPTGVWQFGGTLGSFTLPAAGGQRIFSNLTPGSFTISETAVGGYTAAVSCTNGASGTSSVSVTLNAGNAVTCTFVNTKQAGPPPTGGCDPVPGNLLKNPGFESGTANWIFNPGSTGTLSAGTANPAQCTRSARIAITTTGTSLQFYQTGFTLKPNKTYTLRLTARSSGGEDVSLYVHQHKAPNTNYGLSNRVLDLTSEWKTFEVTFRTSGFSAQTTDTRLRIWLSPYYKVGTVYEFDDVVLVEN